MNVDQKRAQCVNENALKIQSGISSSGDEIVICNLENICITEHQIHPGENFQV